MTNLPLSKTQLAWAHFVFHAAITGAICYLWTQGKITSAAAGAAIGTFGGVWSTVGGVVVAVGRASAVTPSTGAVGAPATPPAAVVATPSHLAAPVVAPETTGPLPIGATPQSTTTG